MTLIEYKPWRPSGDSEALVMNANNIIAEYSATGYTLTLRQLYYQFVARGLIPNTERSYKNLGQTITRAREAGLVSWTAIEDRNRAAHVGYFQEDPLDAIATLPRLVSFDYWERQPTYVEVWVEKEALGNVIERACRKRDVPHLSCKGYLSASEAWRSGRRFMDKIADGKECVLIHLGDHDPSGLDMTRDNGERVDLFSEAPGEVKIIRLALNYDQVQKYNPPPNPTKVTDSRAKGYMQKHGRTCWELDALEPAVIEKLIDKTVEKYIDKDKWAEVGLMESEAREELEAVGDNWEAIRTMIRNGDFD